MSDVPPLGGMQAQAYRQLQQHHVPQNNSLFTGNAVEAYGGGSSSEMFTSYYTASNDHTLDTTEDTLA